MSHDADSHDPRPAQKPVGTEDLGNLADGSEAPDTYDLVVIGSGPHALALVTRLLDDTPDTCGNFWIGLGSRPTGHRETIEQLASDPGQRCANATEMGLQKRILVVDPSGRWMTQWDRQFAALQIPYLRSAFDAHPAAFQSQALKAFAEAHGRDEEFYQLEADRYPGYDGPFRAPGSFLFMDYCTHLVKMYGIEDIVRADTAVKLEDSLDAEFKMQVTLSSGSRVNARVVVSAMGPTSVPRIPPWAEGLESECPPSPVPGYSRIIHAWDLIHGSKAPGVLTTAERQQMEGNGAQTEMAESQQQKALARRSRWKKQLAAQTAGMKVQRHEENCRCTWDSTMKDSRLLIVGGGLTSVHLLTKTVLPLLKAREKLPPQSSLAEARRMVDQDATAAVPAQVTLLSRHDIVVKQFDLNLEWVSWAERPKRLRQFYKTQDMKERRSMLAGARGGGSITPKSHAMLQRLRCELGGEDVEGVEAKVLERKLQPNEEPVVVVEENVEVEAAMWIEAGDSESGKACWEVYYNNGETAEFDQIWLATGAVLDVHQDPVLGGLMNQWPIDTVGGLPVLQPSLRWHEDCPVYLMGPYAQLQLGPDALNLAGSRSGSCRIDTAIRSILRGGATKAQEIDNISVKLTNSGWASVKLTMREQQ